MLVSTSELVIVIVRFDPSVTARYIPASQDLQGGCMQASILARNALAILDWCL